MTPDSAAALIILVLTYVGVAAGRIPGLRLDRAGIAFLGGAAMIALGPLSLEEAFRAIDFDTIALLLGMMIVVAHLKVSGAFRALGGLAIDHAHAPFVLLVIVTMLAGVLSAFLVNDAICLVMAPIVLQVVRALELRQRGDDHRQPAEHGDRDALPDSLSGVRRRAGAGRRV
jgi:Na+/H+ antiporter NhaD/arsenite permease-like protein